jgi:hypothetical protein
VVVALLVAALFGQALAGLAEFNNQLLGQGLEQIGFWRSVTSSDFAEGVAETSSPISWPIFLADFLAVGSMVVVSIYLRERGSPESKPVGQPRHSTGIEG